MLTALNYVGSKTLFNAFLIKLEQIFHYLLCVVSIHDEDIKTYYFLTTGGHLEVCQLLERYGADVNSQDNRKVSVLMAAFRKGHVKTVKWIVRHVTQFPSESDSARFISTLLNDKVNNV